MSWIRILRMQLIHCTVSNRKNMIGFHGFIDFCLIESSRKKFCKILGVHCSRWAGYWRRLQHFKSLSRSSNWAKFLSTPHTENMSPQIFVNKQKVWCGWNSTMMKNSVKSSTLQYSNLHPRSYWTNANKDNKDWNQPATEQRSDSKSN